MKAWIARDPDGPCFVYTEKPILINGEEDGETFEYWDSEKAALFDTDMPDTFHPEVTFENSPMQIALTPDDGIAILKRRLERIQEKVCNKEVPLFLIAQYTAEQFMTYHMLDMLDILKLSKGGKQ